MLECSIGWTRRGVPFWEDNRSEGTMVPSWRDLELFPMEAIVLAVGQSAAEGALPCHQKFHSELIKEKKYITKEEYIKI